MLRDIAGCAEEHLELPGSAPLGVIFDGYAQRFPRMRELAGSIVLACNQQFSDRSVTVHDGDEVAFLPPVSGGTSRYIQHIVDEPAGYVFALTREPIDGPAVVRELLRGEDGAVVNFEGVVRNNTKGRATLFLDYECYESMAIQTMAQIGREIAAQYAIGRIALVHRLGRMQIGETSVAVVVTAPHRRPAFEAALEGINRLKRLVPIWKKEHFADGEVWVEGEWDDSVPARLTSAVFLALAVTVFAPATTAQDGVIRVDVRLVRLLVTVKDAAGALIGSLTKSDFSVLDNGVKQEISLFERKTEQPLSVALLVDTSASTGIELKYEFDSVSRFLRAILREGNPDDAVALYSFNWQVTLNSTYTRRIARLEGGLKQLKSEGGTSLYDAIYLASRDLETREGRHVMVVVTDGGDTTSAKTFHDALDSAQVADTVIYPVLVVPIKNEAGRNVGGENALTTLAAGTGGRVFLPAPGPELDQAFAEILRELRTQYLIGFYPRNLTLTKNRFHSLKITLSQPALRAITRNGYYGEFDDSSGRAYRR